MTPKEIARHHAEVELHFANGGEVEFLDGKYDGSKWQLADDPCWDWTRYDYRIAQPKPKTNKCEVLAFVAPDGLICSFVVGSDMFATAVFQKWERVPSKDEEIEVEEQ